MAVKTYVMCTSGICWRQAHQSKAVSSSISVQALATCLTPLLTAVVSQTAVYKMWMSILHAPSMVIVTLAVFSAVRRSASKTEDDQSLLVMTNIQLHNQMIPRSQTVNLVLIFYSISLIMLSLCHFQVQRLAVIAAAEALVPNFQRNTWALNFHTICCI